jgi:hypothetical protein
VAPQYPQYPQKYRITAFLLARGMRDDPVLISAIFRRNSAEIPQPGRLAA